jgi:lipoprotein-releasing system ATP-binding protein
MAEPILRAEDIRKSFGPLELLKGISLEIRSGESVAIRGKSGEGKTTLLHILGTLDRPDSGALWIAGDQVLDCPLHHLRCEKIGFVFQAFHLLEDWSVLENVLMPAKILRKEHLRYARAKELLNMLDLADRSSSAVWELSTGQKQRVAIARALINDPLILFADEPTGNLDEKNRRWVRDILINACSKEGKALLIVTHDDELAHSAERVLVLQQGVLST